MNWLILILSGCMECVWATALKLSEGFTHGFYSMVTLLALTASMAGLAYAIQSLPLGIAYPVWTGIGAIGSVILSIVYFHDKLSFATCGFVLLLLVSIIGLQISTHR